MSVDLTIPPAPTATNTPEPEEEEEELSEVLVELSEVLVELSEVLVELSEESSEDEVALSVLEEELSSFAHEEAINAILTTRTN